MNWTTFFSVLGGVACVFILASVVVPVLMWLDRRIGTYPTIGCLFLVIGLAGATYAGLTG